MPILGRRYVWLRQWTRLTSAHMEFDGKEIHPYGLSGLWRKYNRVWEGWEQMLRSKILLILDANHFPWQGGGLKEGMHAQKEQENIFILTCRPGLHHPQDKFFKILCYLLKGWKKKKWKSETPAQIREYTSFKSFKNVSAFGKLGIHFRFLRIHSQWITSFMDSSLPVSWFSDTLPMICSEECC